VEHGDYVQRGAHKEEEPDSEEEGGHDGGSKAVARAIDTMIGGDLISRAPIR
jgi:hypothetical protein